MLRRNRGIAFIILFIFTSFSGYSQQEWPSSVLWRISGHGLSKPSYLFGTLHLQDKRLFNFTDSLYRSIEQTEGFAMEIDFNDYMDTLMGNILHKEEEKMIRDEVKLDAKKINRSADTLLRKLGLNKDHLTTKDLKKIRDYRMNKLINQGQMPTIVDAYLYGLALRQGKWVGGIEDVHDQMDILDEIGDKLKVEDVFQPEEKLRSSLEVMTKIYMDQDLRRIEQFSYHNDDRDYTDKMLINRNIKMARRMDSLMQFRSMFFAVGTAHLPGDSGVISFLRGRGFTLEPVFSNRRIAADTYIKQLGNISWNHVEDEDHMYSVEMPSKASEYQMFGNLVKIKMSLDITSMTVYMAGQTIAQFKDVKDLDKVLQAMVEKQEGSRITSKKMVMEKNIPGVEAVLEIPQGAYRVRLLQKDNIMYLMMAGSGKTDRLFSDDVNHFYSSFIPGQGIKNNWTKFELSSKGMAVMVPGAPSTNKALEKQGSVTNWNQKVYDFSDPSTGAYFLLMVRDLNAGYYLPGDSTYFASYRTSLAEKISRVKRDEVFQYQGFPALRYDGVVKGYDLDSKSLVVIRGNRVYTLMVVQASESDSSAENFLHSLTLTPYVEPEWKRYIAAGENFSTTAPAPLQPLEHKDVDAHPKDHFASYDSVKVRSYEIFREPVSEYYWADNDSSFYEDQINQYKDYGDSLIEKRKTVNGQLPGMEAIYRGTQDGNLKKIRVVLNGDTAYVLLSFISSYYSKETEPKKFFDDFRVSNEKLPTIYTSKIDKLLEALKTKDTIEFQKASAVFRKIEFKQVDVPKLQQALLRHYMDGTEYYGIRARIKSKLVGLKDSSTIRFVRENYEKLQGDREEIKYELLDLLAMFRTKESFQLFKQLALKQLPGSGKTTDLSAELTDSLDLALTLSPEIFSLSRDSLFSMVLVDVANKLTDSNKISIQDLRPYEANFLLQARKNIKLSQNPDGEWWSATPLIRLIGKFNDAASNALLQKYLLSRQPVVKEYAIVALLKNHQPVNAKEIETVAAAKKLRLDLYDDLKKMSRLEVFPAAYKNQRSLAEAELYGLAMNEDEEVSSILFLGERVREIKGKKEKFYLYKITVEGEDDKKSHLGVTGPYDLNSSMLITQSEASGIYWVEEFDKTKIESQFKTLISGFESVDKDLKD